jgi:hypothetical protein
VVVWGWIQTILKRGWTPSRNVTDVGESPDTLGPRPRGISCTRAAAGDIWPRPQTSKILRLANFCCLAPARVCYCAACFVLASKLSAHPIDSLTNTPPTHTSHTP